VALVACQPKTIIIETEKEVTKIVEKEIEKVVKETVVVEQTKVIEMEKIVPETVVVEKEKVITATPVPPKAESPLVSRMVQAGEVPELAERIPMNPYVIEGLDGIGNFGGTYRLQKRGQADGYARGQVLGRGLTNIDHTMALSTYMAESFEVSPDASTITFHLRPGTKWSDGEPLTSADYRFWYEDLISNREYTANHPKWLSSAVGDDREEAVFTAPDDYTFSYKFATANGLFTYNGNVVRSGNVMTPMHYAQPYHPEYGDKAAIDKAVAGNDSWDDWTHQMQDMLNANKTIERPTHEPWLNQTDWTKDVIPLKRNPYFWEIDTEGNQLPYIDYLQYREFGDSSVALLRALNGEIDCQARHIASWANYTVFKENEERGDYTTQIWARTAVLGAHFNMTTKETRLADLFVERDFRIAASLSINRDEMNELFYDGLATPMQYVAPVGSPYHSEKLASAYLEYDPDRANQLLDDLGYTEKDSDGYRLFKDGSGDRIAFTALSGGTEPSPELLILMDYFKAIGLEMIYRGVDRALSIQLINDNEVHMRFTHLDRNLVPLADPSIWLKSTGPAERPMFCAWSQWYVNPDHPAAEEPPAGHWVWDLWAAGDELQSAATDEEQKKAWFKIQDIWAEELLSVCVYGMLPFPFPVKNGFKGIKEGYGWDCCTTVYEHMIDNATWYWDEPDKHSVYF
jgi:peptide/nickel transport system substrate-binding protein